MIKYEADLYEPVKTLFENEGYEVKGEVKGCDLVCRRENEIIVCELKLHFNLKLVYQLLDRKTLSPAVYGAVLIPKRKSGRKNILRLMKEIDCGLIFVSEETEIPEVVFNPKGSSFKNNRRTKKLKAEFENRSFENKGGVNKTAIMTAYKEQSIKLLCYLEALGEASPAELRKLGFGANVRNILYNNYYGWFVKLRRGVYGLSDLGRQAAEYKEYESQTEYFRREMEEKNVQIVKK
ncbi:MAG: DUF2161 family putative PD-(D/E)XK-type phosphodiesterase [Clostridiales bacterium]|nr:DUF2161 family putative PD-(D/E)XK-type phosphodiesterase [Clostridiales bacterium]